MQLNLTDLTNRLAVRIGETQTYSRYVIKQFIEILEEAALANDQVRIKNFGTFKVKQRAARTGQNPRTREPINIPARRALVFVPSAGLKQSMVNEATAATAAESIS